MHGSNRIDQAILRVAGISGGKVSNEKIITSRGNTDIDVIGPNGELIGVGGPAKSNRLPNLGNEIAKLQEAASQRGVIVQYYITDSTPPSVYEFLTKRLGAKNVFYFQGNMMTIGTLRVVLPQPFSNVVDAIKEISSLLDLTPVNPSFGKILAWSYEGDELELEFWSADELERMKIQLMTFWDSNGVDLLVSWQLAGNQWSLGFSEARGAYSILERVFGYLARKMATHPSRQTSDFPVIVFGFE